MTFLLIPPYLIFAFFVMRNVLKKQNARKRKWQMGLLTAFLLYLPLGWDVILGRAAFYGLCATQGGVHVYQTVELGSEYFDKDGMPLFYDEIIAFENNTVANIYYSEARRNRGYINMLNISKMVFDIGNKNTNVIYGSYVTYTYFGGWFANYTGFHVMGEGCPLLVSANENASEMINKIFVMN